MLLWTGCLTKNILQKLKTTSLKNKKGDVCIAKLCLSHFCENVYIKINIVLWYLCSTTWMSKNKRLSWMLKTTFKIRVGLPMQTISKGTRCLYQSVKTQMKCKIQISVKILGKNIPKTQNMSVFHYKSPKVAAYLLPPLAFKNNWRESRRHRVLSGEKCYAIHFSIQNTFKSWLTVSAGAPKDRLKTHLSDCSRVHLAPNCSCFGTCDSLEKSTGLSSRGVLQHRPLDWITGQWCCKHKPRQIDIHVGCAWMLTVKRVYECCHGHHLVRCKSKSQLKKTSPVTPKCRSSHNLNLRRHPAPITGILKL